MVEVSGYFNIEFHHCIGDWKKAVRLTVLRCKETLGQKTVALMFIPCEVEYHTD